MVRILITLLRKALPFVGGLIRASIEMLIACLVNQWKMIWANTEQLAEYWTYKAVLNGIPGDQGPFLKTIFRSLAFVVTVIGWVAIAHLTVFLFRLLVLR